MRKLDIFILVVFVLSYACFIYGCYYFYQSIKALEDKESTINTSIEKALEPERLRAEAYLLFEQRKSLDACDLCMETCPTLGDVIRK